MKKEVKVYIDSLNKVMNGVEDLVQDLNDKYDELSQAAQDGDKGQEMSKLISSLERAASSLSDTIYYFEEVG